MQRLAQLLGWVPIAPPNVHGYTKQEFVVLMHKWRRALHMFDFVFIDGSEDEKETTRQEVLEQQRMRWVNPVHGTQLITTEVFEPTTLHRVVLGAEMAAARRAVQSASKLVVEECLAHLLRDPSRYEPVSLRVPKTLLETANMKFSARDLGLKIVINPIEAHQLQSPLARENDSGPQWRVPNSEHGSNARLSPTALPFCPRFANPATSVTSPLPLETPLWSVWELWCQAASQGCGGRAKPSLTESWLEAVQSFGVFNSLESFWCLHDGILPPSLVPEGITFMLFRLNVAPMWEHEANRKGGRWICIFASAAEADAAWTQLCQLLVCEGLGESDAEICGCTVTRKRRGYTVSLWTRNAADKAAQLRIGRQVQSLATAFSNRPMTYKPHLGGEHAIQYTL